MRRREDFQGGGKRRRAATISFLEVLETFGGARVSDGTS
jgi:hypothetical protein